MGLLGAFQTATATVVFNTTAWLDGLWLIQMTISQNVLQISKHYNLSYKVQSEPDWQLTSLHCDMTEVTIKKRAHYIFPESTMLGLLVSKALLWV